MLLAIMIGEYMISEHDVMCENLRVLLNSAIFKSIFTPGF